MAKYYFRKGEENCYTINGHIDHMKDLGIKELTVFEAKREPGTGYFFCKHYLRPGEFREIAENCKAEWFGPKWIHPLKNVNTLNHIKYYCS